MDEIETEQNIEAMGTVWVCMCICVYVCVLYVWVEKWEIARLEHQYQIRRKKERKREREEKSTIQFCLALVKLNGVAVKNSLIMQSIQFELGAVRLCFMSHRTFYFHNNFSLFCTITFFGRMCIQLNSDPYIESNIMGIWGVQYNMKTWIEQWFSRAWSAIF